MIFKKSIYIYKKQNKFMLKPFIISRTKIVILLSLSLLVSCLKEEKKQSMQNPEYVAYDWFNY